MRNVREKKIKKRLVSERRSWEDVLDCLEYLPDLSVYRRRDGDGNLRRLQKVEELQIPGRVW